jgi:hypothetical protein
MEIKDSLVSQDISIADDFLIQVAEQAERRIDAVIKIKKVALKVTNPRDWTDQNGNPYLGVSGSEKVANLFNISWRIDEPSYEEEPDGHYTYSYKGYFSLGGRTAEAEGSRSSKDKFFIQYKYEDEKGNKLTKREEIPISERTNKRDVKMAALTNLLGNGITRILGIRNLTWEDLKEFAGITKEQVVTIQYRKSGEPLQEPQKKGSTNGNKPKPENTMITVKSVTKQEKKKDGTPMKSPLYIITSNAGIEYRTFSESLVKIANKEKGTGMALRVEFENGQFGNMIVEDGLSYIDQPPEEGENAQ